MTRPSRRGLLTSDMLATASRLAGSPGAGMRACKPCMARLARRRRALGPFCVAPSSRRMAIKKWNAPDGFIPNQRFNHYGIKLPMRASESPIIPKGAAGMQRVADWLEKLGLGQYEQRFAENDISFVIPA
jgi:SAM domain (Sterile alpha motif)